MIEIGNIAFKWGWVLSLLLLIPLFWFIKYKFRNQEYAELFMPTLDSFGTAKSWKTQLLPITRILQLLTITMVIIAIARPLKLSQEEEIKAEGIDIVLAMDVSSSMLAKDFEPDRLEASKNVAADFIDKRPYDRIGLVVFSGESYTQCPLTTDHKILKEFLGNLQCGLVEDGTAIGMGLANAAKRLADSESKSKVVILLTDGDNNEGYTSPMQAADAAQQLGIKVYTIGIGTRGRARAPIARYPDGSYVFGWVDVILNEELLENISETTGGLYFRATDTESLEAIYAEIDELEKTEIETTAIRREEERFYIFIWIALISLTLEIILRNTIFRTILQ